MQRPTIAQLRAPIRWNKQSESRAWLYNWRNGVTSLTSSGGNVVLIMFKTGHALPLTVVRFLRPRISRAHHASSPRHRRGEARGIGHSFVRSSDVSQSNPRPQSRLNGATDAATARPYPCPRSSRVPQPDVAASCPRRGNVRAQTAACPHPSAEIVQAAFITRSFQRSHIGATTYVPI